MTGLQRLKTAGLKSYVQIGQMTGEDTEKLRRWAHERPKLFEIILFGCKKRLESQKP